MFKLLNLALQGIICYLNYHFTSIKYFLGKVITSNFRTNLLAVFLTIFFIPLSTIILLLCGLYRLLIWTCLKLRYGNRFRRFVPGCALGITLNDKDPNHITIMMTVSSSKTGLELNEDFKNRVLEKFFNVQAVKQELCCLLKTQFGYQFLIHVDDIAIDEVFQHLEIRKDFLNDDDVSELLGKYISSALPRSNKFAWDMLFCSTPLLPDGKTLNEIGNGNKRTFALIMRLTHAIADFFAVANLIENSFAKSNLSNDEYAIKLANISARTKKMRDACPKHIVNLHVDPWQGRHLIWTENTMGTNKFISVQLSCLGKIKDIRKSFPGVSLLNVLYAAYSAGMADYFAKYHENEIPKNFTILSPLQLNLDRLMRMLKDTEANDFDTDFSIFIIKCPLIIEANEMENLLVKRLLLIKQDFEDVFHSFDIKGAYTTLKLFLYILPLPLGKLFFRRIFHGSFLSCVEGGPKHELFNDSIVENCFFFAPRQHIWALGLGVMIYGQRLQLGFTFDDAKFVNKERTDIVINGFTSYIDSLHDFCTK